ncbi:MAG: NUDIX hydrolase [Parcubacteria group bacterium GW2011_GWA1_54_9]|nr:MAG: NUDIX hydrolase [Parcubacteria group bacterium GW2011_GWA1_54_9]KKW42060.1 MAG: NUDIX hydrolase [Parcubacteria group bacterium GW2011_GWB1_55_9]
MTIATLGIITREYGHNREQVLLGLKRGNPKIGKGKLNGPGGKKKEIDRTILDCLWREVDEEVGIQLDLSMVRKCAVVTFWADGVPFQEVHVYRATRWEGEPHETESMTPYWYDSAELPLERMHTSDRMWFPQLVKGEKFCTNVYYREPGEGFIGIGPLFPFTDHD